MNQNDYFIYSIKQALKYANIKFSWYEQGHDPYHLREAMDWVEVANIYMKGIKIDHEKLDEVVGSI
jgi:hypothetical protein